MQWSHVFFVIYVSAGVFAVADNSQGIELKDYCSMNRFEEPTEGLGFTKEVVTVEYANLKAFKAIHCCLKGYRSIEW